jgi:ubiquinone/menaquinone biosynthesis C-methylase UbiE
LPAGVSAGLWHQSRDAEFARGYDAGLVDTSLLQVDRDFVLEHCKPAGRLIDLGCGTGRLAIAAAQHGHRPVGVDLSPEMLKVLGAKADSLGLTIPTVCANLVQLDIVADASFDHAACLFSTLGLIVGAAARRRVLHHVHRLLRPGGNFVLHVHNRWFNVWTRHGRRLLLKDVIDSWLGRADAGDYQTIAPGFGTMTMHLFTRGEVVRLLRSAGFEIVEVRSISHRPDGWLACPWWLGRLRSYGYLIAARKPPVS